MTTPDANIPSAALYFEKAQDILAEVIRTQLGPVQQAARVLSPSLARGGRLHAFGSGHSKSVALEVSGRAGGLTGLHALLFDELMRQGLTSTHDWLDSSLERDLQNAEHLLKVAAPGPRDAFLIISNSGRNAVIVEMALRAKQQGLPVVAITSLKHSRAVTSRHPSGQRLFEVADVTLDNGAPVGDVALPIPGTADATGGISTLTGVLLVQALHAELVRRYLERGETPPVLRSANLDHTDEHNAALWQKQR